MPRRAARRGMAWRGVRPVRSAIASVNHGLFYTVHTGKSDTNAEATSVNFKPQFNRFLVRVFTTGKISPIGGWE